MASSLLIYYNRSLGSYSDPTGRPSFDMVVESEKVNRYCDIRRTIEGNYLLIEDA